MMRPAPKTYTIFGMKKLVVLFFVFSFIIYFFTSAGRTPYDYFTRLSSAFLHGKYYITENPSWLSELVPGPYGRFYIIQPPMPAILAMPFVFLFKNFEQQILAHILGASLIVLTMILSFRIKRDIKLALWSGLLIGIGSIIWYEASSGSVWYLGQITSAFFLTAALVESYGKRRPALIGFFLGATFLSRIHVILSLPFFLYVIFQNKKDFLKKLFLLGLGMAPFFLFNFLYNFLRFGSIFDKGYFLVPGIYSEPWFSKGMLNIAYIPEHLRILFLMLPKFLSKPPYIEPSWYGLAIWITTPAFIYVVFANIKENITKLSWLSIFLIFTLVSLRGGTGWTQFGYRYAIDFYPFLTLLTIKGVTKTGLRWHHWLLLFIGILVNAWGVIFINKLGFVGW